MSKITLSKETKAKLLTAVTSGIFDPDKFPEFKQAYDVDSTQPKLIFSPTPLSEKDMEDIRRIQNGE